VIKIKTINERDNAILSHDFPKKTDHGSEPVAFAWGLHAG